MKFFGTFIIYILIFTGGAFAYTPEEIDEAFARLESSDPIEQAKATFLLTSQIDMGSFQFHPTFPVLERLIRMATDRSSSDLQLSARAKKIIKMGLNRPERIRTLVLYIGVPGPVGILAKALLQEILPNSGALRSVLDLFKSGQPVLRREYAEVLSAASHDPEVIAALTSELNTTSKTELGYRKALILALAGFTDSNCPSEINRALYEALFDATDYIRFLMHTAIRKKLTSNPNRAGSSELLLSLLHVPEMRKAILRALAEATNVSAPDRRRFVARALPILRSHFSENLTRIPVTTEEMKAMRTFLAWEIGPEVPPDIHQGIVECTLAMLSQDLREVRNIDLSSFVSPLAPYITRYRSTLLGGDSAETKGYRAPSTNSLTTEDKSFMGSMRPLMERLNPLHGVDERTIGEDESMQLRLLENIKAQFHLTDNLRELVAPGEFENALNSLVGIAHPTDAFIRQLGELVSELRHSVNHNPRRGSISRFVDWALQKNRPEPASEKNQQSAFTTEQARLAQRDLESRTLEMGNLLKRHAHQKTFRDIKNQPQVRVQINAENTERTRVRVHSSSVRTTSELADEEPAASLTKSLTALARKGP